MVLRSNFDSLSPKKNGGVAGEAGEPVQWLRESADCSSRLWIPSVYVGCSQPLIIPDPEKSSASGLPWAPAHTRILESEWVGI